MANTPKSVRATAKLHAKALRNNDALGKSGSRTAESAKSWPKMSWNESIKASEYVGKYAGKNSKPLPEKASTPEQLSRSLEFYSYDADGNRTRR